MRDPATVVPPVQEQLRDNEDGAPLVFLLTDIEGSVELWERLGDQFGGVLDRHNEIIRAAVMATGGREVKFQGDGFVCVFGDGAPALTCGARIQSELASTQFPALPGGLRVRVAIHAGRVREVGGDYVGPTVNLVSRMVEAATGGQILVSGAARSLAGDGLPGGVRLLDLGERQLRGITRTTRLYLAAPADQRQPTFVPLRTLDLLPTNLGPETDEFVGRGAELEALRRLVTLPGRLVTIMGPGGVGKTRLARRGGSAVLGQFEDGVWLVDLARISSPAAVPACIAAVLHVPLNVSQVDPAYRLATSLSRKRLLIILDNFEHVLDAADVPCTILTHAPYVRVLVTSRERLNAPGESVLQLAPLSLPDLGLPPADQRHTESVELFCSRAALPLNRELHDDEIDAAARICRLVDGLPLAIELAAAQLADMPLSQLLENLGRRLDLESANRRGLPERMSSVRAAIGWSFSLLSRDEADVFAQLAVFPGGFLIDAATAVCPGSDVPRLLSSLVGKCLVNAETRGGRTRYSLLPLIREYALERLEGREEECRARASAHFAAWALSLDLKGPGQGRDLEDCLLEIDNIRMALEWGEAHGQDAIVRDIVRSTWPAFLLAGDRAGCARWQRIAVDACRRLGDAEPLARMLIGAAVARKLDGDLTGADTCLNESEALCRAAGLEGTIAWTTLERASWFGAAGRVQMARGLFETCMESFRRAGDEWGVVECLRGLARIAAAEEQYDRVQEYLSEALSLEDREAQPWGAMNTLEDLGLSFLAQGKHASAVSHLRDSVELCRRLGALGHLAHLLGHLADVLIADGDEEGAADALYEALVLARRHAPDLVGELQERAPALETAPGGAPY